MTAGTMLVGAASNGTALWYLTRATGLVALVLLTATVVLGVVASVGWTTERWPRFLSQTVHRNLSLFCVGFVAIHVITTVSDGYVPIGFADAFIPFRTPYRPLYVGLGALCFDLLVAVLVTSALRHRIGFASWRFVHWLAYLCWPIAMFHSLGSGSDSRVGLVQALDVVCAVAVFASVFWRLWTGRSFSEGRRAAAAVATVVVGMGLLVFAALGPLRPGWSHRSGTSSALLAQLAKKYAASSATAAPAANPAVSSTTGAASGPVPTPPFTAGVTGTQSTSGPDSQGNEQVTLSMHLQNAASTPLTVVLSGSAATGGGIAMSSGSVTLGSAHGAVTSLSGGTLTASLSGATPMDLTLSLQVDQNSGGLSGTASATAGHQGNGDSH
jgi:DMSO/TMAO reductase YedYZ heme-binding membrane subunit